MSVNTVNLFDHTIVFNDKGQQSLDHKRDELFHRIEDYFSLSGGRIVVERQRRNDGRFEVVKFDTKAQPAWVVMLKIASYVTLIIPIIALSYKVHMLRSYGFAIRVFPSHNYLLENKLAAKLDDIERARLLVSSYEKNIQKTLSIVDQHRFERWLYKFAPILGPAVCREPKLLRELKKESNTFKKPEFESHLWKFIEGLGSERALPIDPLENRAKRIAILYTGLGGGGHKAPATGMKDKLEAEGYEVEMIDTDEIAKEFEPKVCGRGYEDIWTEFYQRRGQPVSAWIQWQIHGGLYHPECRKTTQVVRERLERFNPDLIFAVAHHKPQLASLAYTLNRKMIFVHTDNQFVSHLRPLAIAQVPLKNSLIKFTKPTTAEPENYAETLPKYSSRAKKYQASSGIKWIPRPLRKQIVEMQIPARREFKTVTPAEQIAIKKKLNIDPQAKVCMVMMGNNGIEGEVHNILSKLYKESKDATERLHVIFICGNNKKLADQLNERLRDKRFQQFSHNRRS